MLPLKMDFLVLSFIYTGWALVYSILHGHSSAKYIVKSIRCVFININMINLLYTGNLWIFS